MQAAPICYQQKSPSGSVRYCGKRLIRLTCSAAWIAWLEESRPSASAICPGFGCTSAPLPKAKKLILKEAHARRRPVTHWMAPEIAVAQDLDGDLKPAKGLEHRCIDRRVRPGI